MEDKIKIEQVKKLLMRPFCKHKYEEVWRFHGTHKNTNKDVTFEIGYFCVKCNKELRIKMDEESQIEEL